MFRERTLSDLFEGHRQLIVYGNFRNDKNIESESQLHDEPFVMNRIRSLFFIFFLTMLPALYAERIDHRNFAIDVCYPNPNSIQLAEVRTKTYWAKHASRFGPEPRFLAVQTSKVFPSEVQDLWPKLINSETTGSFFSHGRRNSYSNLQLLGVMIYDTQTGRFVSNQGYISVDTPPRGSVARFGPYMARYIGWG